MNIRLLLIFVVFAFAKAQQTIRRPAPGWEPHEAIVQNNKVKATHQNGEYVNLEAEREKASLMLRNRQTYHAGSQGSQLVEAVAPGRERATASKLSENIGQATAGRHRGQMQTGEQGDTKTADFVADGQYKIDTKSVDNLDRFVAENDKHQWEVDPSTQTRWEGTGRISADRREYGYEIKDDGRDHVEAQFVPNPDSNSRRNPKYKCSAETVGTSTCYDNWGRKVGEVTATNDGRVTVKNKFGIPVGTARVTTDAQGRPVSIIGDGPGSIKAVADKYEEGPCPGVPENDAEVMAPFIFEYDGERINQRASTFKWPACFDIGANIKLAPGIRADRVAFEWIVNVLPIGRLKCDDIGTCGDDCYYCDWCNKNRQKELDILDATAGNICEISGTRTFPVRTKICPPVESDEWYVCSYFTKHWQDEYWKKQGDVHAELRIYERPTQEQANSVLRNWLQRLQLSAEYSVAKAKELGRTRSNVVGTEDQLREFYMKKNQRMIGCRKGVVSYTLAGDKIDPSFLVEAVGATGIWKEPKCDKEEQQQKNRENNSGSSSSSSSGGSGGSWNTTPAPVWRRTTEQVTTTEAPSSSWNRWGNRGWNRNRNRGSRRRTTVLTTQRPRTTQQPTRAPTTRRQNILDRVNQWIG